MKKTLAMIALAITAPAAMAASATFTDLASITTAQTKDSITYTPVNSTTAIVTGASASGSDGGTNRTSSLVTFTLKYDSIFNADNTVKLTTATRILSQTREASSGTVAGNSAGLAYNGSGGIVLTWGNVLTEWNNSGVLDLTSTAVTDAIFTAGDGQRYVTLGFTASNASGSTIWVGNTAALNASGLKASQTNDTILVDNTLVQTMSADSNVALTNAANATNIAALAETTTTAAKKSLVPEPATATLSLLALAGLAARRRRK